MQRTVREERFKRMTANLQLVPETSGNGFSALFKGFKYDDFNRTGLISLPKLVKYFESFRHVCWKGLGVKENTVGTTFIIRLHVEISKKPLQTSKFGYKDEDALQTGSLWDILCDVSSFYDRCKLWITDGFRV